MNRDIEGPDNRVGQDIPDAGFKYHMNDVNATVGLLNFEHLDWIVGKHQENAAYYDNVLDNTPGVTLLKRDPGFESSFWIYSLLVEDRPGFSKWMKECGIATSQVHDRNDKFTCFSESKAPLPNLDKTIGKITHIPVG